MSEIREIADLQAGVVSRSQALSCGLPPSSIGRMVQSGRWQSLQRGVYSVYSGPPSRQATLWAAVHLGGPGAALSHQTAAELSKITDLRAALIHITIPDSRRAVSPPGIAVHRSSRLAEATHPVLLPPRTRLEETVLDLVDTAATFDAAFNVVAAACQRGLTTSAKLGQALRSRTRVRWRRELVDALALVGAGAHSLLEYRYVHLVERPHGLPTATRQAKITSGNRNRYLDNLYEDYGVCVELDGLQAHPEDQRWQDLHRINSILEHGITTLRYGWMDINYHSCPTAAQVGAVLHRQGWPGPIRRCRRCGTQ